MYQVLMGNPVASALPTQKVTPSGAPVFSSSVIQADDVQKVITTFNKVIESPLADYVAGFTIKINGSSDTITGGARAGGNTQIEHTLTSRVDGDDSLTIEYTDTTGDIRDVATATDLATFTAQIVTNNVYDLNLAAEGNFVKFLALLELEEGV